MNTGIGNYKKMTAFRKQGLKVSLGIGGWNEGSTNYSMMASSPDSRRTFIASAVEFLKYVHHSIFNYSPTRYLSIMKGQSFKRNSSLLTIRKFVLATAMIYDLIQRYYIY